MSDPSWRPMRAEDIAGVIAVAATAFPDHFEERARFEERLALFPLGCFALASSSAVKGYLISHPWALGAIPPLNQALGRLPETWDSLFLHDLALHPDLRGRGLARPIVERLAAAVRPLGIGHIALVAVNDAAAFWQSLGFEQTTSDPAIARKLASYGDDAAYMVRAL